MGLVQALSPMGRVRHHPQTGSGQDHGWRASPLLCSVLCARAWSPAVCTVG